MIQIPLSPEAFQTVAQRLRTQHKIEITGDQGVIEKFGVKADYVYANGILSVTILDKPFFLSVDQCEQQLRNWMAERAG